MASDEVRLLHRTVGYTSNPAQALHHEPEAVSEEEQREQTHRAHRAEQERVAGAWRTAHGQIDGALETLRAASPDPRTLSDARVIERTAKRIDERLGL